MSNGKDTVTFVGRSVTFADSGFVVGRGRTLFERVEDAFGEHVVDDVWLASMAIDERIRVLEHRLAELMLVRDELEAKHPWLKPHKRGV